MFKLFKHNKKIKKLIYMKKAIHLKDKTIFDFIIHLLNNKLKVVESSLLNISKPETNRYFNISNNITKTKFKFIKTLFKETNIEGFNLSFSSEISSDIFFLKYMILLYYLLYN